MCMVFFNKNVHDIQLRYKAGTQHNSATISVSSPRSYKLVDWCLDFKLGKLCVQEDYITTYSHA